MNQQAQLIDRLSNEIMHSLECALEAAETEDEAEMWEERIEALEATIERLQLESAEQLTA